MQMYLLSLARPGARFDAMPARPQCAGDTAQVQPRAFQPPKRPLASLRDAASCLLVAVALGLGGGCPQQKHVSTLPPLELATSPDPHAEADFRAAQEARKAGRSEEAERRLKAFIDAWPKDPLEPFARFELGRNALDLGHNAEARGWFDGVARTADPVLAERGRMYSAVAAERTGDHQHALAVLRPLLGRTVDPEETTLVLDTLGTAEEALGDRLQALATRDRELAGELSESQREQVTAHALKLIAALDPTLELPRAYEQLPRDGVAWPEVARRYLRVAHEQGSREQVSKVADDLAAQGVTLDESLSALVLRAERPSDANPGVIGAILPLSGRGREVGESALQGLLYASGLESDDKPRPRLVYRDDGGDPERAVAALEDLVSVHRVIAVIGPLNVGPAQAVAERAEDLGVPVLALNPDPSLPERSDTTYRLLPEPREEAATLVQAARRAGATRIALLYPESSFGQAMRQAFEKSVAANQASLTAIAYAPTTTNFVREAEQLEKQSIDAVILADGPARVALIAPALAARGLWSVAPGSSPPEGRAVLYLIPAAGFDPGLARSARRYLQGALFAVPFDAERAVSFRDGYRARFQSDPNLFAAIAHDAYRILESGLSTGATTRAELVTALGKVHADGNATAVDGFTASRGPRVPVQLQTLLGEAFVPTK
jgi:branched-chain amino acid transport system substrate-binding protein